MESEPNNFGWRFWRRWVLATTIGWLLGIITAFIIAHIVNIIYPKESNLVVGLCLGAVVGYTQRRYARNPMTASGRWVLSSAVGMGIPFVFVVIADELLRLRILPGMPVVVAAGGLITGLLQLGDLRRHSSRSVVWVPASIVGWSLGWLAMNVGFAVGLIIGGAVLGIVTGGAMVWLLRSPPDTGQDPCRASSAGDATLPV